MEIKDKLGAIEAILFASGEPIEIYRLSEASGVDAGTLPSMIRLLNERYEDCGSGICIKKLDSSFQMCTREEFAPQVRAALETKRTAPLSNAAMEALTIIAYNQPVSKGFVENVRGIDSSSVINNLVEKGLVEEAGRLDVPGKPIVYRTTAVFLRSFGLSSVADLPPLPGQSDLVLETEEEFVDRELAEAQQTQ
ncbi:MULTISPECIES: SMC-Scp complex subunit ScpB [Ruminococcus]|uniref:Segregation and condensation protein B n=1 Tax=Ruminococcus flavefaciens TaxID=1265 RepID=A0A315YQ43_RUMFL|nr:MULTISPECIES: SMC-Scp complex subunit ScpB [Ruminococcus]MBQ6170208.1 SMC-Scp complex subunit ScpB [Ruminococcus sp.]MBR1429882.1 SMC-Scp complex subunit ScpB [Ruminococcus sp.]MBR3665852.1 SMC-Scp complex subunit ScpB [Ruminococcus sp.]MBR6995174.1 SMC-Scp complex subunit ScpB [Ruminococcus sp.]PWJ14152.1 segregation and condensation protein B [Ruminococcus flavefaciens]